MRDQHLLALGFCVGFLTCWALRALKGIVHEAAAFKAGFDRGFREGVLEGKKGRNDG